MFHVKQFALIFLLSALCVGQEVRRPTTDADAGAIALTLGCTAGTNIASAAMPNAYDASGLTTASNQTTEGASSATSYNQTRVFRTWQAKSMAYTSLTLNINSQSDGYNNFAPPQRGAACLGYSLNSGVSWTNIRCDTTGSGWARTTDTITLSASQDLATVQVGICTQGSPGVPKVSLDPGADDVTIWDIWTASNAPAPTPAGTGSSAGNAHRTGVILF
jgi:hypothetical protein